MAAMFSLVVNLAAYQCPPSATLSSADYHQNASSGSHEAPTFNKEKPAYSSSNFGHSGHGPLGTLHVVAMLAKQCEYLPTT